MALAFALSAAGLTPTNLATTARVTLEPDGTGFKISRSALDATVPGIGREQFEKVAQDAKAGCPVSKVFNAGVTLEWTLA